MATRRSWKARGLSPRQVAFWLGAVAPGAAGCSDSSDAAPQRALAGAGTSTAGATSPAAGAAGTPAAGGTGATGAAAGQGGTPSAAGMNPVGNGGTAGSAGQGSANGGSASGTAGADNTAGSAGIALFNGEDLSGFAAFREPQTPLSAEEAAAIFKVDSGTIHVYGDAPDQSTQARYTLVTLGEYSKYRLNLEYQWGTKKFAPYTDLVRYPRDAGVLFHLHGDTQKVWPSSIEFQIKDGTTGDIFALYARCTSLASGGGTTFVPADAGGTEKLVDGSNGFVQHGRSENFELPGWNQLLLEVREGTATFVVNGQVVNQVLSVMDRTGKPVSSGPIALQAEHAEVFYRNIVLEELP